MSTTQKPTPAPWLTQRAANIADQHLIYAENDPKGYTLALVYGHYTEAENAANARLIASAPSLLDIARAYVNLAELVSEYTDERDLPGLPDMLDHARRILAQIEGS